MKTINVSYEDLAKTMTQAVCGTMSMFDLSFSQEMKIQIKDAFQKDLIEANSIEKAVKYYDEEIEEQLNSLKL